MEESLIEAAEQGDVEAVSTLLRDHPEINVNWQDESHWTALHVSSRFGHPEVVKLLLAHPDIDANICESSG